MIDENSLNVNPIINEIVDNAVRFFENPGPVSGNSQQSLQFAIQLCRENHPDFEISSAEMTEIEYRFIALTTHPPGVTEEELVEITHTDESIDGTWFEQIQEFPKWDGIRDNWINGHPSSRMPPTAINNIDKYSSHIIQNSNDPAGDSYLWKGLVVGNVQSGKTATYTGLIGKAIDVGYRIILIMSGRMNSLRYQTEGRVTYQIVGVPDDERSIDIDDSILPLTKLDIDGDFGARESSPPSVAVMSRVMSGDDLCLVGVIKKHPAPIEKFATWADEIIEQNPEFRELPILIIDDEMDEAGTNIGGEDTGGGENQELPTYVGGTEEDEMVDPPSSTNQAITNLLREERFSRRMYLGFTATPYAIILHRRREVGSDAFVEYGPDIFPDNYLMVLDDPDSYCGGDVFLGRNEVVVREMSRNENGSLEFGDELLHLPAFEGIGGIFNEIDDSELGFLVPNDSDLIPTEIEEGGDYEHAEMTESLEMAIDDFIISGAARIQRGDGGKPCTMMVNVSHRWAVHFDVRRCILNHLSSLSEMYETRMVSSHLSRLEDRWNNSFVPLISEFNGLGDDGPEDLVLSGGGKSTEEQSRTMANSHGSGKARPVRTTSFEDISPFIAPFIHEIAKPENNRVLNRFSDDIVDFDNEPNMKAIIHGGYNLGRGLTFKGMVSTYLLRGHGDMSGLMQMQRWCGYRGEDGGERVLDLMRLYMQNTTRLLLQRMLTIERKNRYMLGAYIREDKTPAEFRAVMEQDPDYPLMSAAKQGDLREVGRILTGATRTQRSFKFTKEEDLDITHNKLQIDSFLNAISQYRFHGHSGGGYVYRDVPTEYIQSLLEEWRSVETSGFRIFEIESWIKRLSDWNESQQTNLLGTHQELTHWTIYLPSRTSSPASDVYVDGFDPDEPIDLSGKEILPYSYNLDRGALDRLRVISSPDWTRIDETLFFSGGARPSSHGLMLISPIIHPLNRNSPGGALGDHNPSILHGGNDLHNAGDWPSLISLGFWFPTTHAINTILVEHGSIS